MLRIALRPKFIGLLLLALLLAAVFALLSQWQIGRAFVNSTSVDYDTETVVPLAELQTPQSATMERSGGHLVSVDGAWVDEPAIAVGSRTVDGIDGYWGVLRFRTADDVDLAVAVGWATTAPEAVAAADALVAPDAGSMTLEGRFFPSEGTVEIADDGVLDSLNPAVLVNVWAPADVDTYSGFLVSDAPAPGLTAIVSTPPEVDRIPSFLNLFYALEWIVFGLGAFYIWYRLVKDEWLEEHPEADPHRGRAPDADAPAEDAAAEVSPR